jgi:hypothetical protein
VICCAPRKSEGSTVQKKPPRSALPVPYLAFLETGLIYGTRVSPLRVHLVARRVPSAIELHAAVCGAGAAATQWRPTTDANPAFSRRFIACRTCARRHPAHFETITRTL